MRSILEDSPSQEAASLAVREHIVGEAADLLRSATGKNAARKLGNYLSNRGIRETLKVFPKVRKELNALLFNLKRGAETQIGIARDIDVAKKALVKTTKEADLSAAKFFVANEPVKAVERVFNSGDPEKAMQELVDIAKKSGSEDALNGLIEATSQFLGRSDISGRFRGTKEVAGGLEVLQAGVSKLLDKPRTRNALAKLYDPGQMKRLKTVQSQLRIMDRINQQVTAGSPTASLQNQVSKVRIVLASMYGIIKGRGIFQISDWIMKALGADPVNNARL